MVPGVSRFRLGRHAFLKHVCALERVEYLNRSYSQSWKVYGLSVDGNCGSPRMLVGYDCTIRPDLSFGHGSMSSLFIEIWIFAHFLRVFRSVDVGRYSIDEVSGEDREARGRHDDTVDGVLSELRVFGYSRSRNRLSRPLWFLSQLYYPQSPACLSVFSLVFFSMVLALCIKEPHHLVIPPPNTTTVFNTGPLH